MIVSRWQNVDRLRPKKVDLFGKVLLMSFCLLLVAIWWPNWAAIWPLLVALVCGASIYGERRFQHTHRNYVFMDVKTEQDMTEALIRTMLKSNGLYFEKTKALTPTFRFPDIDTTIKITPQSDSLFIATGVVYITNKRSRIFVGPIPYGRDAFTLNLQKLIMHRFAQGQHSNN